MKSQEDTVAVMVVYQPPESVLAAIDALLPQVKALVVVDNGSNFLEGGLAPPISHLAPSATPAASSFAKALEDRSRLALLGWEHPNIVLVKSPQNNLAHAQNLGIAKARELGASFVLLMDDDSLPAPDMVAELRAAWREGMAVVASYLQEPTGRPPHYIQAVGKWGFRRTLFNPSQPCLSTLFYVAASGSLIPLSIIDALDGMDESLGLYFVDTEFCLRARKAGYDVVAVQSARMQHHFGNVTSHRLLGKTVTTTNHPAPARERMFRNRKVLWRGYCRCEVGYVIFDLLRAASEIARILLFEAQKRAKLRAIARGLFF